MSGKGTTAAPYHLDFPITASNEWEISSLAGINGNGASEAAETLPAAPTIAATGATWLTLVKAEF